MNRWLGREDGKSRRPNQNIIWVVATQDIAHVFGLDASAHNVRVRHGVKAVLDEIRRFPALLVDMNDTLMSEYVANQPLNHVNLFSKEHQNFKSKEWMVIKPYVRTYVFRPNDGDFVPDITRGVHGCNFLHLAFFG